MGENVPPESAGRSCESAIRTEGGQHSSLTQGKSAQPFCCRQRLAAGPLQHQQAQHAAIFAESAGYVDAVVRIQHLAGNGVFTAGHIRDAGCADFDGLFAA